MNIALPEGVKLPNSAGFGKQYLNINNVYRTVEDELFFLALKAKEVVGQDLLDAREELGLEDEGRDELLRIDFVRANDYNYFFYEHDVKKKAVVSSNEGATITAATQESSNFNLVLADNDRDNLETGYVLAHETTREIYYVANGATATPHEVELKWIPGGTYSNVENFPPTFTNRTTATDIDNGDKLIVLGSIVQHGASEAIQYRPLGVSVRQGRVQSMYEKFGKTLQGLYTEGGNLTRTTDFTERMSQFMYDFLSRCERTIMYSKGDFQTIGGGSFYFSDGIWDQIGTKVAANTLDGAPTVPTLDSFDDIIERISQTGSNYVICVGRKMRRFVSKILRNTNNYRINKTDSDRTIGNKLLRVIGHYGDVPICYNPSMNHSASLVNSVMALNVDNIIPVTVSEQASIAANDDLGIVGNGMLKMKRNLQSNEELNVFHGVYCDMGWSLAHQTTHYLFENWTGVSS